MAKGKRQDGSFEPRILNRKARYDYEVLDKLECGIQLQGSEVKSVRLGQVSLAEGYAQIDEKTMQLHLFNVDIAHYKQAGPLQHDPKRTRKLLAHKREINRLLGKVSEKGVTLAPLAMYFKGGRIKVEIGVARGKQQHDKRRDIKKRETDREIRRAMSREV